MNKEVKIANELIAYCGLYCGSCNYTYYPMDCISPIYSSHSNFHSVLTLLYLWSKSNR
jgi:hypothetical protein